jgi:hypothetical protein
VTNEQFLAPPVVSKRLSASVQVSDDSDIDYSSVDVTFWPDQDGMTVAVNDDFFGKQSIEITMLQWRAIKMAVKTLKKTQDAS